MSDEDNRSPEGHASPMQLFPLDSFRLTTGHVRQLAVGMGLEARGDLQAVYDGLRELGQDPATVQVAFLTDAGGSTLIQLHNAEGSFLEALPIPPEDPVEEDHTEEPPRTDYSGVEALQAALKNAEQKQEELARSLEHCRSRLSEVWRNSCEQARMLDSEVGRRGDEITFLKARVADLERELHLARTSSSADRTLESGTPDHGSSSHVLPDHPSTDCACIHTLEGWKSPTHRLLLRGLA